MTDRGPTIARAGGFGVLLTLLVVTFGASPTALAHAAGPCEPTIVQPADAATGVPLSPTIETGINFNPSNCQVDEIEMSVQESQSGKTVYEDTKKCCDLITNTTTFSWTVPSRAMKPFTDYAWTVQYKDTGHVFAHFFGTQGYGGGSFTTQAFYTGVWRPGSGEQRWHTGLSLSEFETQDRTYFDRGLRIQDVEIVDGQYAVIWRSGDGPQRWRAGMTLDELKREDQRFFDEGLYLHDVEVSLNGTFTAIWRPGRGEQRWHVGLTKDEFHQQSQAYFDDRGLRLQDVERHNNGDYVGVWRSSTDAQWVHTNMTLSQFTSQDQQYFQQGFRLHDVEMLDGAVEVVNGTVESVTAVWWPGSGSQHWHAGLSRSAFISQDEQYFNQGLRLVDFEFGTGQW